MTLDTPQNRRAFYTAATLGLQALDARLPRPRRFGAEADARWRAFQGQLGETDRLELLVRDAAATQAAAFAPRVVFGFAGLAADEPFGPSWPGPDADHAAALLRGIRQGEQTAPAALDALLDGGAAAWGLAAGAVAADDLAALAAAHPATRIGVAGVGALRALIRERDGELLGRCAVVSERPGVRQLAGLAAAWLGVREIALVGPDALAADPKNTPETKPKQGQAAAPPLPALGLRLASADATDAERQALAALPEG